MVNKWEQNMINWTSKRKRQKKGWYKDGTNNNHYVEISESCYYKTKTLKTNDSTTKYNRKNRFIFNSDGKNS